MPEQKRPKRGRQRFPHDFRAIVRLARKQGWRTSITNGNHYRFTSPQGRYYVTAFSPSDRRGIKNLISDLRALGLTARS